jgi:LacI family transcriptional regulator
MRRASIKDVAREAGVSTTTVSYVLNERTDEKISPETVARIREAVTRLHYVPNQSARSLISRQSRLIGVVIPQTEPGKEFMFSNPFYGELLSAIEYTARENGYHLLLSGTDCDQSYLRVARNRGVDGIIIIGTYPSAPLDELRQVNVPVVLVDSYIKDPTFHTVGINDRAGGRMATRHLIERGHTKIAFVSGSIREHGVHEKRYKGYCDALYEANLPLLEEQLYIGNVDFAFGLEAARMLTTRKGGETGAFVSADVLAMGFVKGIRSQGQRVPQDMSVVGFDDLYLAQMCDPSLTTVHQDIRSKGTQAARIVIDAIQLQRSVRQESILPLELVERDSVLDLRKGGEPR